MIVANAFQLRDVDTGLYLEKGWVERIDVIGTTPVKRHVWDWKWNPDPLRADSWGPNYVDQILARPDTLTRALDGKRLEKVPAPRCGCCGQLKWAPVAGVLGTHHGVREPAMRSFVVDGEVHWRCEKHVGRNPCCIEGCKKTFAHKSAGDYDVTFICGTHYRQAPKRMRDRVAKARKMARSRKAIRLGQDERWWRIYSALFYRCIAAVQRGLAPQPTILERSSGPPPAALVAELERLGL